MTSRRGKPKKEKARKFVVVFCMSHQWMMLGHGTRLTYYATHAAASRAAARLVKSEGDVAVVAAVLEEYQGVCRVATKIVRGGCK
jgi:hypothetical protein